MKKVIHIFSLALLFSISGGAFAMEGGEINEKKEEHTPPPPPPPPHFYQNGGWCDLKTGFLDKLNPFAWLYRKNHLLGRVATTATVAFLILDNAHVKQGIDKVKKAVGCNSCQKLDELEEEEVDVHDF